MGRLRKKLREKAHRDEEGSDRLPLLSTSGKGRITKAKDKLLHLKKIDKKELQKTVQSSDEPQVVFKTPTLHAAKVSKHSSPADVVPITKKAKMKAKREQLLHKLSLRKTETEELKARKKREKTVITGDLKPLVNSLLEAVDDESETQTKTKKSCSKQKGTFKRKKEKKQFLQGISIFHQVNSHPEFLKNPLSAISTHIENKMRTESAETK